MATYTPLTLIKSDKHCSLLKATSTNTPLLSSETPALESMTDFCRTPSISVPASTRIDSALDRMIFSGVRLLFVVDTSFSLLGYITSYDIQSEKPMLYLQTKDCQIGTCSREDITVQDIMTPLADWRILNYDNLTHATLGNIVETFKVLGQRHILVGQRHILVEQTTLSETTTHTVRGLFSASTLERALGINIEITNTAKSFADIKRAFTL